MKRTPAQRRKIFAVLQQRGGIKKLGGLRASIHQLRKTGYKSSQYQTLFHGTNPPGRHTRRAIRQHEQSIRQKGLKNWNEFRQVNLAQKGAATTLYSRNGSLVKVRVHKSALHRSGGRHSPWYHTDRSIKPSEIRSITPGKRESLFAGLKEILFPKSKKRMRQERRGK